MKLTAIAAVLLLALLGASQLACTGNNEEQTAETPAVETTPAEKPARVEHVVFGEFVTPEDSLPTIRYFEGGLVSLNDRCAVRRVRLNTKMPPAYVNGHPVGFC